MDELDINLLRGVALVMLIVAFVGMWAWAWSDKRKADFKKMSELPLEEDQGEIPGTSGEARKNKE